MATPKKKSVVHWALDASLSDFGSPFSEGSSAESTSSTSSLQYINSQLLAHGFTQNPGLSLDGLQKEDSERVVKCLLGMLSQRIEDMSRTEDLSAKIRTLSYEHERLMSMYKTATDRAGNAEREMNTHKSRLASATLNLQNTETAHKRTMTELQKLRTTLQGLRTQHAAEMKKVEKEKDRIMERWNKLSDAQAKLGSTPSGINFANSQIVEASDVQMRGKGQGFLELSLEQAERSRKDLADETRNLRGIVISAANELQRIMYTTQKLSTSEAIDEPSLIPSTSLFPLSPANAARDKVTSLLNSTRELSERLAQSHAISQSSPTSVSAVKQEASAKEQVDRAEVEKLQNAVKALRTELSEAQKQSATYAAQAHDLLERFSAEQLIMQGNMTKTRTEEEKGLLDQRIQELEEDQRKFSETAVKLGKEKAALEAERIRFLEEKRSWEVERMLNEIPSRHRIPSTSTQPMIENLVPAAEEEVLDRSHRRSPRKVSHKVKSSGALTKVEKKTTRISRRSSGLGLSPKKQTKVIPSFETEVIPSTSSIPEFKLSMTPTKTQLPPVTSAFVLPPPSPASTFNTQDVLLSSAFAAPISKLDIPSASNSIPLSQSDDLVTRPQPEASSSSLPSSNSAPSLGVQADPAIANTPSRRPFPMAKPFTARMIHAYSPVKPSPLSRILMLANSPESPENRIPSLGSLSDENESPGISPTPGEPMTFGAMRSLAAELGVSDDDDDAGEQPPLREKQTKQHNKTERRVPVKDKGKARADERRTGSSRHRGATTATLEKENKTRHHRSDDDRKVSTLAVAKKSSRSASTSKASSTVIPPKIVAKVKGGARRVPIDSAEAAIMAPAWKG
ncbi:hypothetical protein EUX98_g7212 [Antrodiella citrinella]|uniref:Afadin and alpha-actinin-binding-domain-containing protein n=1 Tax=Antrodiella citrinella TaxID=2447956 RepID=A0A4S4MMP3_9APHY|nr:hypothetical protein EUX98_g7212 [Antrodiella citrinella]